MKDKLITAALGLMTMFISGTIAFAVDWQKEQDKRMRQLDKLIVKQQTLLEGQLKLEEMRAKQMPTTASPRPYQDRYNSYRGWNR